MRALIAALAVAGALAIPATAAADPMPGDPCALTNSAGEIVEGVLEATETVLVCVAPDGTRSSWGRSSWGRVVL